MNQLLEMVERDIKVRRLFRHGQKILVAVSGGVDSMVLLHVLHHLAGLNDWHLTVAHFNHKLRGRSSDADERLVRRTAGTLRLRFISESADVRTFARERKISIEMAAREMRHGFLARTAARLKIPSVALAHHVDDQLELFFLRLLRGSGGEGLGGMKWRNQSPANSKIELIRPLLQQSKDELEKFALEHKIPFREDRTNFSLDFQRNRIRNELLPLLKKNYQPAIGKTILRVMEIAGAESELAAQSAREWLRAKRSTVFGKLPLAVQRRVVQTQLIEHGIEPDFELIERLRCEPVKAVTVSPQVRVCRELSGRVVFDPSDEISAVLKQDSHRQKLSLRFGNRRSGRIIFAGAKIAWKIASQKTIQRPKFIKGRERFDADKIGSGILLRHWEPGDRFQPIGMKASVKLQDLFTNLKIPRERRGGLLIATTFAGEIFWVEGLRMSERFKLDSATTHCLQWKWRR